MEEADALGDRIAVMSDGNIQAIGTSFELKNEYGKGYHFKISKENGFDNDKIDNIIKENIEYDKMNDNGTELSYLIPMKEKEKISKMIEEIENKKEELKYNSLSLTMPTLEDVFVQLNKLEKIKRKEENEKDKIDGIVRISSISEKKIILPIYETNINLKSQFKGMCYIIMKELSRSTAAIIYLIIYPVLIALICGIIDVTILRDYYSFKYEIIKYPHEYTNEKLLIPYVEDDSINSIINNIKDNFPNKYEYLSIDMIKMEEISNSFGIYDNKNIVFGLYKNDSKITLLCNGKNKHNSRSILSLIYNSKYKKLNNKNKINVKHMKIKDVYF